MSLALRTILGVAGTFEPSHLPTCQAWWDPQSGVTLDGSSKVSSWKDRIANYDATQATASARPGIASINGVIALSFAAGSSTNVAMATQPASFITDTSETWTWAAAAMTSGSGFHPSIVSYGANERRMGPRPPSGMAYAIGISGTEDIYSPLTAADVLGARFTTTTLARQNGVQTGTGLTAAANPSGALAIGRRGLSSEYVTGSIGDVIVTGPLTTAERDKIEGYLAWKYRLESNLPTSHPYRYNAP